MQKQDILMWKVEWKCTNHPNVWKSFSNWKAYPSEALASLEQARKRPGCIDARIVERILHVQKEERLVDENELRGRI